MAKYYLDMCYNFIDNYKENIIKLDKFKECVDRDEIFQKMKITDDEYDKFFNYKIVKIKKKLFFSTHAIINRKQDFIELNKNMFVETKKKPLFLTQSFTDYDNIDISLSSTFFGKYKENVGRLFIFYNKKTLKMIDIGNTINNRTDFNTMLTNIILGNDAIKEFKNIDNKNFFCYRISCVNGTLDEKITNYFVYDILKRKKINGILRYDSGTDTTCGNINYLMQEYFLCNPAKVLLLSSIFINNTFFFNIDKYKEYIKYLIKLYNLKLKNKSIVSKSYHTINECLNYQIIKTNIKNNTDMLMNNNFYKSL